MHELLLSTTEYTKKNYLHKNTHYEINVFYGTNDYVNGKMCLSNIILARKIYEGKGDIK